MQQKCLWFHLFLCFSSLVPAKFDKICVLQKYVEKVSRLASLCQHDSTDCAADELEALVSMRVRHCVF